MTDGEKEGAGRADVDLPYVCTLYLMRKKKKGNRVALRKEGGGGSAGEAQAEARG